MCITLHSVKCGYVYVLVFVMCGCSGNTCTCIYCVLHCFYCVFVLFRLCVFQHSTQVLTHGQH
jgi:hypothetical protein